MNSRKRVITALRREVPDKVPKFFTATPAIQQLFEQKTGKPFLCYEEYFNMDLRMVHTMNNPKNDVDFTKYHPGYSDKMYINEWGIGFEKGSMYHFDRLHHPLKNIDSVEQVDDYPLPDLSADYIFDGYKEKVNKVKEKGYATIGMVAPNPIQPECMDPVEIKLKYGDKLAFWGCIGTQTTMPFSTVDEVRKAVKHVIENVGKGGGLLIAPTHVLEPEVPWENIVAFAEAVEEFGWY